MVCSPYTNRSFVGRSYLFGTVVEFLIDQTLHRFLDTSHHTFKVASFTGTTVWTHAAESTPSDHSIFIRSHSQSQVLLIPPLRIERYANRTTALLPVPQPPILVDWNELMGLLPAARELGRPIRKIANILFIEPESLPSFLQMNIFLCSLFSTISS